jgi:hypothetical protein
MSGVDGAEGGKVLYLFAEAKEEPGETRMVSKAPGVAGALSEAVEKLIGKPEAKDANEPPGSQGRV